VFVHSSVMAPGTKLVLCSKTRLTIVSGALNVKYSQYDYVVLRDEESAADVPASLMMTTLTNKEHRMPLV